MPSGEKTIKDKKGASCFAAGDSDFQGPQIVVKISATLVPIFLKIFLREQQRLEEMDGGGGPSAAASQQSSSAGAFAEVSTFFTQLPEGAESLDRDGNTVKYVGAMSDKSWQSLSVQRALVLTYAPDDLKAAVDEMANKAARAAAATGGSDAAANGVYKLFERLVKDEVKPKDSTVALTKHFNSKTPKGCRDKQAADETPVRCTLCTALRHRPCRSRSAVSRD